MQARPYLEIVESCESDLEKHGDTYEGVGWTKKREYAELRYQVMLDLLARDQGAAVSLLDFGCGASHLLEYIKTRQLTRISYSGLDLSTKFLALSRAKFPAVAYHQVDLLEPKAWIPTFDYVVMNGLFNYKGSMSFDEMWIYCRQLVRAVRPFARRGLAFNVMSTYLDWERDDLFHVPLDTMAAFLDAEIGRHFTIRHDYGLFEYTVYAYATPTGLEPWT